MRRLKVQSTWTINSLGKDIHYPKVILQGKWLESLDIKVGENVIIREEAGRLVIEREQEWASLTS